MALGHALVTGAPGALAITVAATMLAICAWATTVGALVPILAQKVGLDPAVLSAPMIATLVDATGLVIYFTIAKAVLAPLTPSPTARLSTLRAPRACACAQAGRVVSRLTARRPAGV